jgi:hypothetical protein
VHPTRHSSHPGSQKENSKCYSGSSASVNFKLGPTVSNAETRGRVRPQLLRLPQVVVLRYNTDTQTAAVYLAVLQVSSKIDWRLSQRHMNQLHSTMRVVTHSMERAVCESFLRRPRSHKSSPRNTSWTLGLGWELFSSAAPPAAAEWLWAMKS